MSFGDVVLWTLTIVNSFVLLLVVRQLAQLPAYRSARGPSVNSSFAGWTLSALDGRVRTSQDMPEDYTMLFASERCGPCHDLLAELGRSDRVASLIVAADAAAPRLQQLAMDADPPVCMEFLTGADRSFRQQFRIPGTPFAMSVRAGRVVTSGPARSADEVRQVAQALRPRAPGIAHV